MSVVKILPIKWYQCNLLKIQQACQCSVLRTLWSLSTGWDSGTADSSCHQGILCCVGACSYLLFQPDRKPDPPLLRHLPVFSSCSSLTKTRKKKKLLILPGFSTKCQASWRANSSDSCHTTSVSCVWELSHSHWLFLAAVLSWKSDMTTCSFMKTFPGIQSSHSHSCNHAICVCRRVCCSGWVQEVSAITALCCFNQVEQMSRCQRAASPVAKPVHVGQNRLGIVRQDGSREKAIQRCPPAAMAPVKRVSASLKPNTWLAAETASRLPAAVQRTSEICLGEA